MLKWEKIYAYKRWSRVVVIYMKGSTFMKYTSRQKRFLVIAFTFVFFLTSMSLGHQEFSVKGTEEEGTSWNETESGQEVSTEETTEPESTTEEPTKPPYEIIDGLYKVQDGYLIDFLADKEDASVTDLTIPAVIEGILPSVFAEHKYLKTVKFENGSQLKELGIYAFKNCSALTSIELPKGLQNIGYKCFGGCSSLETLTIPSTVTTGESIVGQTSAVKKVIFAEGTKTISDSFLKDAVSITAVSMKSGITSIGKYAFSGCTALKEITIPKGVKTIGYKAFVECSSLKSLTIPGTVTQASTIIGSKTSVKTVVFSAGASVIPAKVLYNASTVTKVLMSDGVKTIETGAFQNCTGVKTISVPNSIKEIQPYAFYGCTKLEKLTTPKNMTTIGKYAFKNCTSLKELVLRKVTTSIGTGAFSFDSKLTLLVYANTTGKAYARKNKLKWDYTSSEKKRREKNTAIYKQFLAQVSVADRSKYKLKYLTNYVPQGTTIIGKYLVVSMYHKNMRARSFLLIYDKNTGKYVKKVYLPSVDHVGALVTIKNRLVVGINNISVFDYVGVINYSALKKAKNNKTIKYSYKRFMGTYVDFAAFDGKVFWAGHCSTEDAPKMTGFKVKIKKKKLYFTRKYSFVVPKNVQGLIVRKGKGTSRTFIFSQSYGRLNNSCILKYKAKITKSSLGVPIAENTIPSMSEGICMDSKKNLYIVFESASGLYCGNPDNTSEIQIKRVYRMKSTALSKLTTK